MRNPRRALVTLAALALLTGGGAAIGVIVSSVANADLKPRPEPRALPTQVALTAAVDQKSAGQNWARTAFDGGLRQCPAMNPEFFAACEAEMQALAARPGFTSGSLRGPLLVTEVAEPEKAALAHEEAGPMPDAADREPVRGDAPSEPRPY